MFKAEGTRQLMIGDEQPGQRELSDAIVLGVGLLTGNSFETLTILTEEPFRGLEFFFGMNFITPSPSGTTFKNFSIGCIDENLYKMLRVQGASFSIDKKLITNLKIQLSFAI